MSYVTVTSAIRQHLEDYVNAQQLGMPVVWQNQEFEPEKQAGEIGWLYCEIELQSGQQASIGAASNFIRSYGLVTIYVVVPRGALIGGAEAIAGALISHFKAEALSGIHFTNRWVGSGSTRERESRWYGLPVLMEFWTDRLETPA